MPEIDGTKGESSEMKENPVSQFLESAGHLPYRELIAHHIKKQSVRRLQEAVLGEGSLLPAHLQGLVEGYIDGVSYRFAYNKQFWETATCKDAFDSILETAVELLPIEEIIATPEDALHPDNQLLAFQLFQIATVSFAYSASLQRKFMGIRKGILG